MSNTTTEKNFFMEYYQYLFVELGDPRTNDWFLVKHPVVFPLVFFYLYFVTKLGPRLMENRKPIDCRRILIFYNAFQVALSSWICSEAIFAAYGNTYSWNCEPVDFSLSPNAMRICRGIYVFYWAKISELLDTIFFVLRKKNSHLSFLHLYHHSVMPMVAWGAVKYLPGGNCVFIGMINSFVHIMMYSYYMLAAVGPQFQKYLWWKKHITNLQLIQFCLVFLHNCQLLFYDCGYPKWTLYFTLPHAIFFYFLFANFYEQAYTKRKEVDKTDDATNSNSIKNFDGLHRNGINNGKTNEEKENSFHQKSL